MNRRDRLRIDERRREANGSHRATQSSNNTSGNEKSLMDSYFRSQKVIQSLTSWPGSSETDATKTKSFRIPRKESKPEEHFENRDRSRSRNDINERKDQHFSDKRNFRFGSVPKTQPKTEPAPNINSESQLEKLNCRARKHNAKRYNKTKPIQVILFDRKCKNGQIHPKNVPDLVRVLTDVVKTSLQTDKIHPRFLGYHYKDGMFVIMCANMYATSYLREKLDLIRWPWPGAKLDIIIEQHKECVCTAVIPESISHFSEFLALCKKGNKNFIIEKWRHISQEICKEGGGKLTTFGMDAISCEIIMENNGILRCGDIKLEVQVKFAKYTQVDL